MSVMRNHDFITFTIRNSAAAGVSDVHLSKVHTSPVVSGMSHGSHTHSEPDNGS